MTRYVLIGQKRDSTSAREDVVLGYYTDIQTLQEDKLYYCREYCKFFVGRETAPPKLPPITDNELFKILKRNTEAFA